MTAAAVGREVWWWLSGLGRLLRDYTLRSVGWLGLVAGMVWDTHWTTVAVLTGPVLAVAGWARIGPVSYRRRLADPVWRRGTRRRLKKSWATVMETCGLGRRVPLVARPVARPGQVVPAADRLLVPRLRRLRWVDGQLVAWPLLLPGQTVADVEDAAERLRTTLGAGQTGDLGPGAGVVPDRGPVRRPADPAVPLTATCPVTSCG